MIKKIEKMSEEELNEALSKIEIKRKSKKKTK